MAAFPNPPEGVRVSADPQGETVHLLPWLIDHGRHDVAVLKTFSALGAGLGRGKLGFGGVLLLISIVVVDQVFGFVASLGWLLLAVLVAGAWLVTNAVRDDARQNQELDLTVADGFLWIRWRSGQTVTDEERVALRDIGRVDAKLVGYQRLHVVANVRGRDPVVLPVERESEEAAHWLAAAIAELGRQSRAG